MSDGRVSPGGTGDDALLMGFMGIMGIGDGALLCGLTGVGAIGVL